MTSYPVDFYILDDGTWLVLDNTIGRWVHVPNLMPILFGTNNEFDVHISQLDGLLKRAIAKCSIGFEFLVEIKPVTEEPLSVFKKIEDSLSCIGVDFYKKSGPKKNVVVLGTAPLIITEKSPAVVLELFGKKFEFSEKEEEILLF